MVYRTRSRYTPGSGVLAFFEQVSRFVSLSVALWIGASLFFFLFLADGKITDSLDLKLFRGLFSDWRLFGTFLMFIGLSGLVGLVISLPASLLLLLSRQYLDSQLLRFSRRENFFRVQVFKYLPAVVLLLSHAALFLLNIISAPQVMQPWLREGSRISEGLTRGHFALAELTQRRSLVSVSGGVNVGNSRAQNTEQGTARQMHVILVPASQIESDEFDGEHWKLLDAVRVPFVISKSSIIEQVDSLLESTPGQTSELARKILASPRNYTKVVAASKSQVILSLSPQIRFGHQLAGYGTQNLDEFNDSLLVQEAQRRLTLSQVHIFGLFRILDGVPFAGVPFPWLNLVADDVARLRKSHDLVAGLNRNLGSLVVIQLNAIEKKFQSVNAPFRPMGWVLQQSSSESRIVSKNLVKELVQYLRDVEARKNAQWVIIPYADDHHINPQSVAFIAARSELARSVSQSPRGGIGILITDVAREISRTLRERSSASARPSAVLSPLPSLNSEPTSEKKLTCFETESDTADLGFKFQPVEFRERSLGQLLNSLPSIPAADLAVLGKSMSSLVSRELGLSFLCRTVGQSVEEIYLLKHNGIDEWSEGTKGLLRRGSSILINSAQSQNLSETTRSARSRASFPALSQIPASMQSIQSDVLDDFVLLQFNPEGMENRVSSAWSWRRLDTREIQFFFSKFQTDVLHVIELSARARIR